MLTYLHCYADDLWEEYEKSGLLKGSFGIRFCQNVFGRRSFVSTSKPPKARPFTNI